MNIYGDKSEHYDDGKRTPERKISVAPTSKARKRVSQRSRYPDNYSKNSRKAAKKTKKQQANLYGPAKRRNFAADI